MCLFTPGMNVILTNAHAHVRTQGRRGPAVASLFCSVARAVLRCVCAGKSWLGGDVGVSMGGGQMSRGDNRPRRLDVGRWYWRRCWRCRIRCGRDGADVSLAGWLLYWRRWGEQRGGGRGGDDPAPHPPTSHPPFNSPS